eukprot:CAMPEP_0178897414 /NCGR_PEP_ID=MMETSP0786-20121207/1731_1 /TAXON_ID=186022 /ORGANISM="Thalassionema frauenfeldii, Strain CCMP 1798" /LENGTH=152 /DNA_ID=CAMNT_0020567957 /DNA_START=769 /DNA_END=1223 /DNA_ORIENTATION=-
MAGISLRSSGWIQYPVLLKTGSACAFKMRNADSRLKPMGGVYLVSISLHRPRDDEVHLSVLNHSQDVFPLWLDLLAGDFFLFPRPLPSLRLTSIELEVSPKLTLRLCLFGGGLVLVILTPPSLAFFRRILPANMMHELEFFCDSIQGVNKDT